MECKEESVCAGELLKEVEEIQKLCSEELQNSIALTQTKGCSSYFTILCC